MTMGVRGPGKKKKSNSVAKRNSGVPERDSGSEDLMSPR